MNFCKSFICALALCVISISPVYSQGQANNWFFGDNEGLNFNTSPVSVIAGPSGANVDNSADIMESASTISDANGNFLFGVNGNYILSADLVKRGNLPSGSNWNAAQGSIIVPVPGSSNKYFITTTGVGPSVCVGYSANYVPVTVNGTTGNNITIGAAVTLPSAIIEGQMILPKTDASNNILSDYWLILHGLNNNAFYVYSITSGGISYVKTVNAGPSINVNCGTGTGDVLSYMKSNGCYTQFAQSYGSTVYLYDFNTLDASITAKNSAGPINEAYGLEFSSSGNNVFVSTGTNGAACQVYKIPVSPGGTGSTLGSVSLLGSLSGQVRGGALQMAPDGKIYAASFSSWSGNTRTDYLGAISSPDASPTFNPQAVTLPSGILGMGLPSFMTSLVSGVLNIKYQAGCKGTPVNFSYVFSGLETSPSQRLWKFYSTATPTGAPATTSTSATPSYTWNATGTYAVTLELKDNCLRIKYDTVYVVISDLKPTYNQPATACAGSGVTFVGTGASCASYKWYTTAGGSTAAFTGCNYVTTLVKDSICTWVEPDGVTGGPYTVGNNASDMNNSAGATSFDALSALKIDEVMLRPKTWYDPAGTTLTITIKQGATTICSVTKAVPGDLAADRTLTGLGLVVPQGSGYTVTITGYGAGFAQATGTLTQKTGVINVSPSGALFNWKVYSMNPCTARERVCAYEKVCCTPPTDNPKIDPAASTISVCSPNKATVVTKALTNGLAYKWQVSHNNGTSWTDSTGATGTVAGGKVTLANVSASGWYRIVIASVPGNLSTCIKTSDSAVVVIKPLPTSIAITVAPNQSTFCKGVSHVLTATATTGSTFQWKYDGTGTLSTTNGLTTVGTHKYKVIATLNGCVDSSAATNLTVNALPDSTITQVGPFCSNDAAVNLSAATAGGIWKVDATTLVGNSFNPASYSVGAHQIHYNVTANGCSSHDTITVQINQRKNAAITAVAALCKNAAAKTLTGTDAGGTWSGTGITNTSTGVFTPSVSGAGTFTITYTISGTCGDSKTTSITVNPTDSAKILPAGPFCSVDADYNMKLTAGSTTGGTWSGTGITNASLGTFSPATGNGSYNITYTTAGACPVSDNISVTVSNSVTLNITSPKSTYCHNASKDTIEVTALGGKFSTWSGKGITDVDFGYYDPKLANIGNDTIWYMKAGSCGDTTYKVITITSTDTAKITLGQGPFCQSQGVVTLAKEAASNAGTWSGTGITNGGAGTFDPSVGAGSYLITYKTSGSCPYQDTATIKVVGQKIANIVTADTTMCKNASTKQIRISTNSTTGGTWQSAPTPGLVTNTGVFNPTTAGVGVFKVYYVIPGATLGCSAADSVLITVSAIDTAKITLNQGPFCLNDPVQTLKVEVVSSAGTWSGTGITNTATGAFNPATATVGPHLITYKTSGACFVQDTMTIYVVNQMIANITLTAVSICEDTTLYQIQKSVNTTPGGTWSSVPTGVVNVSGQFNPATATAGTTYKVLYSVSGATATCSAKDSVNITVVKREDASITTGSPLAMCVYDAPKQIAATNSGGVWSGTGVNGSGLFTATGPGTFKVKYTMTGSTGRCPDKDSINVVVLDTVNSSIQPTTGFCQNLPAQQLIPVTTGGVFSGTAVSAQGVFDPSKAPAGTYTLTYTQSGACSTVGHINVTIDSLPSLSVKPLTGGCVPIVVDFADVSTSSAVSSKWNFGDGSSSATLATTDASTTHYYTTFGNFKAELFVTFANGCKDSASNMVSIAEVPSADFSFDPIPASTNDPTITFVNQSTGAVNYFWNFGNTGAPDTSVNTNEIVLFDAPDGDTIPVTLISYNAVCADTITKDVYIKDAFTLYAANAFTPNGDGNNDLFYPKGKNHACDVCTNYEFLIFDRWGEVVFKSTTVDEPWNGKRANILRDAEIDVYVWRLTYTDSFTEKQAVTIGHVTLLR
jgi:gliding motility-associated-like protein